MEFAVAVGSQQSAITYFRLYTPHLGLKTTVFSLQSYVFRRRSANILPDNNRSVVPPESK